MLSLELLIFHRYGKEQTNKQTYVATADEKQAQKKMLGVLIFGIDTLAVRLAPYCRSCAESSVSHVHRSADHFRPSADARVKLPASFLYIPNG